MRQFYCVLFLLCGSLLTCFAQGPELLLQQYNKNSYDLEYYRKWNFEVNVTPHFSKPTNREAKSNLQLNLGTRVHYRLTKSFGLTSGLDYHRLSYRYAYADDNSVDRLRYLRVPFLISVFPVKRFRLSLGGSYQFFLKGTGQPPPATERSSYPSRTFINSVGVMTSVHYIVWRKFSASLGFHFQKRSNNSIDRESQNFQGFSLGIAYTILNPNRPKQ